MSWIIIAALVVILPLAHAHSTLDMSTPWTVAVYEGAAGGMVSTWGSPGRSSLLGLFPCSFRPPPLDSTIELMEKQVLPDCGWSAERAFSNKSSENVPWSERSSLRERSALHSRKVSGQIIKTSFPNKH